MKTPEPTWPPPPSVPDPRTEHDASLAALIRDAPAGRPLTRLHLVRELHEATGLDLRQSLAVVNGFCDRHGLFPPRRGWRAWLPFGLAMVCLGATVTTMVSRAVMDPRIAAAPTRAARRMLLGQQVALDEVLVAVLLVALVIHLATLRYTAQSPRRQAEEARRKMTEGERV